MDKVRIKTSKKKGISAVIHEPKRLSNNGLAIILPGFLDSKDYSNIIDLAMLFSNLGYEVVRFDPTGTWESGGTIDDYSITQYLDDIKDVFAYMVARRGVNYERTVIAGHSLGAMMAIIYAAQNQNTQGVLAIMPPQSFIRPENMGQRFSEWKKQKYKVSTRDLPQDGSNHRKYKVSYSFVKDSLKYDALDEIKKIKVPVILIAGEDDDLITPEHVNDLYESASDPKDFQVINGIEHDYRYNKKDIVKVRKVVLDLVKKHKLNK